MLKWHWSRIKNNFLYSIRPHWTLDPLVHEHCNRSKVVWWGQNIIIMVVYHTKNRGSKGFKTTHMLSMHGFSTTLQTSRGCPIRGRCLWGDVNSLLCQSPKNWESTEALTTGDLETQTDGLPFTVLTVDQSSSPSFITVLSLAGEKTNWASFDGCFLFMANMSKHSLDLPQYSHWRYSLVEGPWVVEQCFHRAKKWLNYYSSHVARSSDMECVKFYMSLCETRLMA